MKSCIFLVFLAAAFATTFFKEDFSKGWEDRWVYSDWKPEAERGTFKWTAGEHGDGKSHGIQTSQDARFYTIASKIEKPFSSKGKTVIFQYTVKHEQNLDCGGSYVKLLPAGVDLPHFKGGEGEDKYNVMFGPDWCGGGLKRIHAIFNYKGANYLLERNTISVPTEPHVTHLYALQIHPNNSYTILIDNKIVQFGSLTERPDYTILPEKQIPDPAVSKPSDWVDDPEMDDPEDKKPENWDSIPATIPDPNAKKPDDWDDELDGEWEAPQIANPEYKGEWKAKRIPNPNYKGPWSHPLIDNPDYKVPEGMTEYEFGAVGIEIWQVKSGTVFSNFLFTDSEDEATKHWESLQDFLKAEAESLEKAKKIEAEKRAAEEAAKKAEEEKKAAEEKAPEEKKDEKKDEL